MALLPPKCQRQDLALLLPGLCAAVERPHLPLRPYVRPGLPLPSADQACAVATAATSADHVVNLSALLAASFIGDIIVRAATVARDGLMLLSVVDCLAFGV
jgi:hypothetical protein